jgi:prophage regulatory protein
VDLVGGITGLRKRGIRWTPQHLARLEASGIFPKRVRIGPNTIDWISEEIDGFIEAAAQARDAKPPAE